MSDHCRTLHPEKLQNELGMNEKKIIPVLQHPAEQYLIEELNAGIIIIYILPAALRMKAYVSADLVV